MYQKKAACCVTKDVFCVLYPAGDKPMLKQMRFSLLRFINKGFFHLSPQALSQVFFYQSSWATIPMG